MPNLNVEDFIPVIVNSLDGKSMTISIESVFEAINALGKRPFIVVITSTGLIEARNRGFEKLKEVFKVDKMRGILLDSDVLIYPESFLYEEMKKSMEENYGITSGYVSTYNLVNVVNPETDRLMSIEEYAKIPDMTEIKKSGLGFYFGEFPLNYHFQCTKEAGEDIAFFNYVSENIHPIKLAKKIHLGHMKYLALNIPDYGDA